MTKRFYEVDPADPDNPANHYPTDANGTIYAEGKNVLTRILGARLTLPGVNQPSLHLYLADVVESVQPPYTREDGVTTTFVSNPDPMLIRVREEKAYAPIDIEELRSEKLTELEAHGRRVYYSGCQISAKPSWAVVLSEQARRRDITPYFNDREGDRAEDIRLCLVTGSTFPDIVNRLQTVNGEGNGTGVRARWPGSRKVFYTGRNISTGNEVRDSTSDIDEYGGIVKDIGQFDLDTEAAFASCEAAIRGETDYATLAAIDVQSQADWGWPDYYPAVLGASLSFR